MKTLLIGTVFTLAFLPNSYALDCGNISGKYVSTKIGIVTRTLTVQQKSCDMFTVKLDNGSPGQEETILANNAPYTFFAHDKSGNGKVVPNGQPIDTSLKDRFKIAKFDGTSLKVMEIIGWRSMNGDKCIPAIQYQPDCSVTEIIYSLKDSNTLVETQNGFTYQNGNMIPNTIEYKRVK